MLELYQHDLSDVWDQDLDVHGEYGYALDRYWDTEGYHAFLATSESKYAGFALVNQSVRVSESKATGWISSSYSRSIVGAVLEIFSPGRRLRPCRADGKSVRCR